MVIAACLARCDCVGKRHESLFPIPEKADFAACDDRPNPPVMRGAGAVGGGRGRIARWVRVVIADHLRPCAPRSLVRSDQRVRIDLEMARRIGVDIGGGLGVRDRRAFA